MRRNNGNKENSAIVIDFPGGIPCPLPDTARPSRQGHNWMHFEIGIGPWSRIVEALPDFLFRFVKKALQQQLPTASNLARWKRIASPNCILCGKSIPQTNKHLLSHCAYLLDRYQSATTEFWKRLFVGSTHTNLSSSAWRSIYHSRHDSSKLIQFSSRRSDRKSCCTTNPASQSLNLRSATRQICWSPKITNSTNTKRQRHIQTHSSGASLRNRDLSPGHGQTLNILKPNISKTVRVRGNVEVT